LEKEKEERIGRGKTLPCETKEIDGYGQLGYALWKALSAKTALPLLIWLMCRTCIVLPERQQAK